MPYIDQRSRERVQGGEPNNAGELAYVLSFELTRYLQRKGTQHQLSWQDINDCLGAIEGTKIAFEQEVVLPYELAKRAQNGAVFSLVD